MASGFTTHGASRRLKRLMGAVVATAAIFAISIPAIAADFGSSADVQSVRAVWQKITGSDQNNQLVQVVVAGDYAVAETHNTEPVSSGMQPNKPFLVLYHRDPGTRNWRYKTTLYGSFAECGLTAQGIPAKAAAQFVARVPRLAADQRNDPNWGCQGGMEHGGGHRPLSGGY
ncbi:MAG: hypothetical protein ACYDC3_00185 [Candidatus Binataceae bacterium]